MKVIEDSAHAFGSIYKGKKIGSQGYINCFSFDGIKNITTGEGGCVVTNDKTIINKIKNSRSLGVINESELRYKNKKKWKINVKSQGWRYHMSDINAAIGNAQLKRFKFLAKKRQSIAKLYDKIFLKKNHLLKIFNRDYNKEVPHIYCVVLNNSTDRDKLREKLLKNNIQTGIHYIPGYLLDYYKKNKRLFPNCEKVHKKVLTLPLHPDISPKNINFITKNSKLFRKIEMSIKILDCTLRDGGYYNNWQFSKKFIQNYIDHISRTEVDYIEIGFIFFPQDKKKKVLRHFVIKTS